jgi:hypothetical protein
MAQERGEPGHQQAVASAKALGRLGVPQRILGAATLQRSSRFVKLVRGWEIRTLIVTTGFSDRRTDGSGGL